MKFWAQQKHSALAHTWLVLLATALSACSLAATPKPAAKIELRSPENNAQLNVGQATLIQGRATGDGIAEVIVLVDNQPYAALPAPDKTKGVGEIPINLQWTPSTAGSHIVQVRSIGVDGKELAKSDPIPVTARGAQAPAAPAAPTLPPPPTIAPAAPVGAATPGVAAPTGPGTPRPGATTAPASGGSPAAGGAELTVTNEFARVRGGPDTAYQQLGQLNQGDKAPVTGKSADGKWWQISYKNSPGWVFGELASVNDAAKNVTVASAAALPSAPAEAPAGPAPAPVRPVVSVDLSKVLQPVATVPPAAPPAPAAPPPAPLPPTATAVAYSVTSSRNILRVDANPIPAGSGTAASWSIPSFRSGSFDMGDGRGFVGPIEGNMRVSIPYVASQRNITLKWTDSSGAEQTESLALYVVGSAPAVANVGGRGILRINPNPVGAGGSIVATWNSLPGFVSGEFDSGDGSGFKGPIAATMNVDIGNVTGNRTMTVRWKDNAGATQTDSLVVVVAGTSSGGVVSTPTSSLPDCNSSNPDWRGGNGTYTFCVRQDLEWDFPSKYQINQGDDKNLTMKWMFYGINGIRLKLEPSSQVCGPSGSSGFDAAVNGSNGTGNSTYTFNTKNLGYGGYKLELFVTRKDGQVVGHNEKFLCVGN